MRESILIWVLRRVPTPTVPGEVAVAANIAMASLWDHLNERPKGRPWWVDPAWNWVQTWEVATASTRR